MPDDSGSTGTIIQLLFIGAGIMIALTAITAGFTLITSKIAFNSDQINKFCTNKVIVTGHLFCPNPDTNIAKEFACNDTNCYYLQNAVYAYRDPIFVNS